MYVRSQQTDQFCSATAKKCLIAFMDLWIMGFWEKKMLFFSCNSSDWFGEWMKYKLKCLCFAFFNFHPYQETETQKTQWRIKASMQENSCIQTLTYKTHSNTWNNFVNLERISSHELSVIHAAAVIFNTFVTLTATRLTFSVIQSHSSSDFSKWNLLKSFIRYALI